MSRVTVVANANAPRRAECPIPGVMILRSALQVSVMYAGSTPSTVHLSASFAFKPYQPVARISRFRPAFDATFLPGSSTVPLAERVLPTVLSF